MDALHNFFSCLHLCVWHLLFYSRLSFYVVNCTLNSRDIPIFMRRGFFLIASAILHSTRYPIACCAWDATRSSISPLFGLEIESKRSAIVSGDILLFSTLRDFKVEFCSRDEQRVAIAKSLIYKNQFLEYLSNN